MMLPSARSNQTLNFGLRPADAWIIILSFAFLTSACLVLHLGKVVNYGFPAGAFLVAAYLYRKYPVLYFSFALWIWFLCSLVRRLADFQSGWTNPSPILLAPLLVALVSIVGLHRNLQKILHDNGALPFLLSGTSVIYGSLIGLLNNLPASVIINLLGWLTPILLGLHLFMAWQDFPAFKKNIYSTFLWGTFIVGFYGVIQFLVAPDWDKFWLNNLIKNLGPTTFGNPEPLEIRVFSTLHAPQALGGMLMPGLILLLTKRNGLQIPTSIFGYLAFLLSSARSAWVSFLVGILIYASFLKPQLRLRLITSFLIGILLLAPLVTVEPFSTVITPRLESLSNVKGDNSFQDRADTFNGLINQALFSVVGEGLAGAEAIGNDNGFLTLLISLGWVGSVPYLIGIFLGFTYACQNPLLKADTFSSASLAIALGSFSQITTNVATTGIIGVAVWVFLGAGMAATRYYKIQLSTHH
jgi:hypothetical protein